MRESAIYRHGWNAAEKETVRQQEKQEDTREKVTKEVEVVEEKRGKEREGWGGRGL